MTTAVIAKLTIIAGIGLLAGCVNLAPNYERPRAPVAESYTAEAYGSPLSESLKAETSPPGIRFFEDEQLQQVLALALENNRDLRVATLNIVQAQARYGVQNAATLPNLQATARGNSARSPADTTAPGQPLVMRQYYVSLGTSAYELDFFGRLRNLKAQAMEQFLATEQAARTVRISLVTEVANTWFDWSANVEHLALAKEILRSQRETLTLMQRRFELGDISALDLRQQEVFEASARAEVARLEGQYAKNRHALTLLLGTSLPSALTPEGFRSFSLPSLPPGLPSDLMLRRPDLLRSEHQLKAANANIGVARAAFYPSISLTASAGTSSADLDKLFKSDAKAWNFAPQINLPIFAGGANRANLSIAKTTRDIALADYEKAIQTAFREVSDALVDRTSIDGQLEAQRALVKASAGAFELSQARYDRGLDNWLDVLNAERTFTTARQGLIDIYKAQLNNQITLYKVLGGDWG